MRAQIRPVVISLLMLTIITGVIYPLLITGIAKIAFAHQAGGSVIIRDGQAIGSELIAQPFTDAKYFWPRPSACAYNAAAGSGSNLGPTNPALAEAVAARTAALKGADPGNDAPVPIDLVTASASGLDPHISLAAAEYQAARIARARHLSVDTVEKLISRHVEEPNLGMLGERRINVLSINLALDHPEMQKMATTTPTTTPTIGGPELYRARGFMPGRD